ncbi:MAG: creatininase family protein [Deltaproteobacteria bacterium]|nr:creatininase family protein [Deltaproteobacteria bacterium]MBW2121810.1 creatininase family protein [Deltaproteobacteria bacterium]
MIKQLKDMTWQEAKKAFKNTKLGIIPTGSIEQHGPHLPLGTDFVIADYIAKEVSGKVEAIVTPTIPIGFAAYHQDFEGTLSIPTEILASYYQSVADSLILYGITHILFINGHGGNGTALTAVCQNLRDKGVTAAFIEWWKITCEMKTEWKPVGHGDISETSIMLAMPGNNVDLQKAALRPNKPPTDKIHIIDLTSLKFGPGVVNTYLRSGDLSDTGDLLECSDSSNTDFPKSPADATAENGQELLKAVVDYIVEFIDEFKKIHFDPV